MRFLFVMLLVLVLFSHTSTLMPRYIHTPLQIFDIYLFIYNCQCAHTYMLVYKNTYIKHIQFNNVRVFTPIQIFESLEILEHFSKQVQKFIVI